MPAARRPISHGAAHKAGERDALVGNLDAVSRLRVRIPSGQQTIETVRRALRVIAGSGISLTLTDAGAGPEEAQLTVTNTNPAPPTTQVMSYRLFTSAIGAATTAAGVNDYTIAVNSTAAAATVTLPASAGNTGRIFVVKHATASQNTVTVDADGAELIDGNATVVLNTRGVCRVQSTGTGWIVV
jgi:hypothetical protein